LIDLPEFGGEERKRLEIGPIDVREAKIEEEPAWHDHRGCADPRSIMFPYPSPSPEMRIH
jgi:hypothetical protein